MMDTTISNNQYVFVKYIDYEFYPMYMIYYRRTPEYALQSLFYKNKAKHVAAARLQRSKEELRQKQEQERLEVEQRKIRHQKFIKQQNEQKQRDEQQRWEQRQWIQQKWEHQRLEQQQREQQQQEQQRWIQQELNHCNRNNNYMNCLIL